ncbi:unnamed protein product [Mesocestoides corti]|uniref:Replication protein A subunit n=1 Tax=Mesocestoides corti TaxID=53468 RepID=A0A0R3U344_MESCO|nr:unnamed protein product [Mesocestoides corti]
MIYKSLVAMLATQLNHLIENKTLVNGCILRLKKYVCHNVQKDKCVIIVLDVEVVGVDDENSAPQTNQSPNKAPTSAAQSSFQPTLDLPKTPTKSLSKPFMPASPDTPGGTSGRVFAIQSLNPYQSRWTIRARVSQKATIRTWNKNGREGKLFSFTLLDSSGEIRATAFNAEVDKFYDMIEVNKVYYISKATLKPANKQFNTTNNDYEMTLNSDTQIVPCDDGEEVSVPSTSFNFVPIGKLDSYQAGDFVDIVAIVHETGDLSTVVTKAAQRELQKRDLGLVDDSGCLVRLTLWGNEAATFDGSNHPVVVVKSAKVSDFNGRSLTTVAQSSIMVSPTGVPDALRLKGWYEREGGNSMNFETYRGELTVDGGSGGGSRDWNLLSDLEAPGIGTQAKPDFFTCKASNRYACVTEGCQKKVVDLGNGLYRCEKCGREVPTYKWRLLLSVKISDMTGEHWITCFQDTAETILGRSAEDLGAIKESQNEAQMDNVFVNATFNSWLFRLRAKIDNFNDESRLRITAVEAKPVDFADYGQQLQKQIDALVPSLPAELTSDEAMA